MYLKVYVWISVLFYMISVLTQKFDPDANPGFVCNRHEMYAPDRRRHATCTCARPVERTL